jgi:hypothetical protein
VRHRGWRERFGVSHSRAQEVSEGADGMGNTHAAVAAPSGLSRHVPDGVADDDEMVAPVCFDPRWP